MKATIYFIYRGEPARSFECDNTKDSIESTVRYWLGKSPGMFMDQLDLILAVPEGAAQDVTYIIQKKKDEEFAYEEKMREEQEKREFERLSQKYGKPKP